MAGVTVCTGIFLFIYDKRNDNLLGPDRKSLGEEKVRAEDMASVMSEVSSEISDNVIT